MAFLAQCPHGCGFMVDSKRHMDVCPVALALATISPNQCRFCGMMIESKKCRKKHARVFCPVTKIYPKQCPNGCGLMLASKNSLKMHTKKNCLQVRLFRGDVHEACNEAGL